MNRPRAARFRARDERVCRGSSVAGRQDARKDTGCEHDQGGAFGRAIDILTAGRDIPGDGDRDGPGQQHGRRWQETCCTQPAAQPRDDPEQRKRADARESC